jgi:electron transfer flavoprotein beta subunit
MKERHWIVCVKAVVLDAAAGPARRTAANSILNPFDAPALALAFDLRRILGGTVTTVSMGPPAAGPVLRETLALGADRAVLLCDPAMAGADTVATAAVLAAAVGQLSPVDLILFGTRSADSDTGQVGAQTATALRLPLVADVQTLVWHDGRCRVTRDCDGFLETYDLDFPAALTVRPEAAAAGDLALGRLEAAFAGQGPHVWDLNRLGLSPGAAGQAGSPTVVRQLTPVRQRKTCRFIEGDDAAKADELVRRLVDGGLIG